ncbi:MAG: GlsB/YeaQ/YmgE family stress response membrane protein [Deltaproteobacteria bacterium]|nr:GlsB/YeaQ/YmgE family stress response membrane protein [Deltaproteobacteria bacterium]
MSGLIWILMAGLTGWLAGKIFGGAGYGRVLIGGYAGGLDVVFGIVGASIGGYLFFWAVVGEGGSFNTYANAILGSVTLVGAARLASTKYWPVARVRGAR